MRQKRTFPPGVITSIYAVVATAWIILSDMVVTWLHGATPDVTLAQTGKGLFFVATTSLMLHVLITLLVRRAQEVERSIAAELERKNRFYATLVRANEAALGATDRTQLSEAICRALVECAGLRLAWVGWVEPGTRRIVVEATAGPAVDYITGLAVSVDPARPDYCGPTGRAMTEGRPQVCDDIEHDERMAPWRGRALAHGMRSNAAVRLRDAEGGDGTLAIYSGEKGFFTPDVVQLVEQLAADLERGLAVLAARGQIERQSAALRASEERWQFALEGADEGVWDWDIGSGRVYYSPRLETMLGYAPGEFRTDVSGWEQRLHPEDRAAAMQAVTEHLEGSSEIYVSEHRLRCKDGGYRWIRARGKITERDAAGRPRRMIGTHADVTEQRSAHQLIANALAFSEAVFNSSPIGLLTFATDGHMLSANAAAAQILGAEPARLRQVNFRELPTWRATGMLAAADAALATGRTEHRALHTVTAFGREVSLEVNLVPFHFEGERRLLVMLEDVSEKERTTEALKFSEQRWKFALEGAGDGVWDWNLMTGAVAFSPQLVRMFGYEPEEFTGRFEEWVSHVHPDDIAQAQARLGECLAGREEILRSTHRLRCKDGSYRWVFDRGKVVERDAAGRPLRMIGIFTDVTELRRSEQRLLLLDTALQAMPAGIVITDRDGRIEWVNRGFTQLTGYSAEEAQRGDSRLLRSGRHPTEFYRGLWQTILRGEVWNGELVNRRKDGTEYSERMIIAPVSHAKEGITHFIAIKQDITGQRELEARFNRAQRMESIGQLAGGIAHDLNNVLAPMLLSVELLRGRLGDPFGRRTLDSMEAAARRGAGIVRQVLTFARGIDGERAPLRPGDLVRELVEMIGETFPRDIRVVPDLVADAPLVLGDGTQIHQVLLNLAVNARDAMPGGGELTICVRPEEVKEGWNALTGEVKPGTYVLIAVRDTGEGMAPAVRDRLFEPFFTTKPRGKGTGLGLATVLGIVRSHGGFIDVVTAPGEGSEFRVYLPAIRDAAAQAPVSASSATVVGAGRTLLVCDDEAAIREAVSAVLTTAGFNVLEAVNGQEAVALFSAHRDEVCAVVMDLMMPVMTGDRAAAEILRQRPGLPVVFMSGLMEQEAVETAMNNLGGTKVVLLKKPFVAAELFDALREGMDRR